MNAQDIIIGSGPSGLAAAKALAAKGRDVLMLDAGLEMDERARELRARMGGAEPEHWSEADRGAIGGVSGQEGWAGREALDFCAMDEQRVQERSLDLAGGGVKAGEGVLKRHE